MKKYYFFFKYVMLFVLLIFISEVLKSSLDFDKLLYNSLAEKFTSRQIEKVLNIQEKWKWVVYVFIPVYVLIKTIIIASILYIGIFFSNKEVEFKKVWNVVLNAEFIFLLVPVLKVIWFYFFQNIYTLDDFQYFHPLSALNITGYKGVESWLIYPLQVFNLFELVFIIYLAYQIGHITKTNPDNGLKIVSYSYLPALLLWVTVVMFFTLNYS